MTDSEKIELAELRRETGLLKDKIALLQNEIEDNQLAITNLDKWKKGRGTGFFIMIIVTVLFTLALFPYTDIFITSFYAPGSKSNAVGFSTSLTALTFGTLLLVVLLIITIITAIIAIAEAGNSFGARSLANLLNRKNYYNSVEPLLTAKQIMDKEMYELRAEIKDKSERLKYLESIEEPWNA